MDDDDREVIVRLCTRAGMMMEDASVAAITSAGLSDDQLEEVVSELQRSATDIGVLILAAEALMGPI